MIIVVVLFALPDYICSSHCIFRVRGIIFRSTAATACQTRPPRAMTAQQQPPAGIAHSFFFFFLLFLVAILSLRPAFLSTYCCCNNSCISNSICLSLCLLCQDCAKKPASAHLQLFLCLDGNPVADKFALNDQNRAIAEFRSDCRIRQAGDRGRIDKNIIVCLPCSPDQRFKLRPAPEAPTGLGPSVPRI